ncbi:MAG TPA: FG-GAP repeat protein, partial [Planctomycetota bacterium]|nr:FG-GAP repeat protein [Planctomycetota bacterium]
WIQVQKVTPNDAANDDGYGASTLLDGSRLLVGAKFRDEGATNTGAVYVYERIAGFYLHATKLVAGDAADNWFQGDEVSLAMDGDVVISTAWGPSSFTGAAYAFQLPRLYCAGKLNTAGCVPIISYNGLGASSTSASPFLVTAALVLNDQVGIMIYSTNGEASIPFQGGTLCIGSPVVRTPGQFSGGIPPPNNCTGKFNMNFNAYIQSGIDPSLTAGATVNAQYWYRDPTHPVGGSGLSNAIEFSICD